MQTTLGGSCDKHQLTVALKPLLSFKVDSIYQIALQSNSPLPFLFEERFTDLSNFLL